jgi:hypothetical protein
VPSTPGVPLDPDLFITSLTEISLDALLTEARTAQ